MTQSHVYVIMGDITHLKCDAWMLKSDSRYSVTWNSDAPLPILTAVPLHGFEDADELRPRIKESAVADTGQSTFGIERVKGLSGGKTAWGDLAAVVRVAALNQERDDDADWWSESTD